MSERGARRATTAAAAQTPVEAPQRVGRRERNKRDKRDRILAAARTLFRARGFESATLQQIADLADVGFGTLYLYAESKEDLLVAVFRDEMQRVVEEAFASAPEDATLPAQLEHMFGRHVGYFQQDLALARVLIRELTFVRSARRRQDIVALVRSVDARTAELVRRAQERGEVRADVVPRSAARLVFSVYYQLLQGHLGGYSSEPLFRRHLRAAFELLMGGLAAAPRVSAVRRRARG